jgi:hypothetical protein
MLGESGAQVPMKVWSYPWPLDRSDASSRSPSLVTGFTRAGPTGPPFVSASGSFLVVPPAMVSTLS